MARRFGGPEKHVKGSTCVLDIQGPDIKSRGEDLVKSATNEKRPEFGGEEAEKIGFHDVSEQVPGDE